MSTTSTPIAATERKTLAFVLSALLVFAGILAIVLPPIDGLGSLPDL